MEGAYKAKFFVNDFLKKDVPQRVFEYRNAKRPEGQWFLDDETLPTPETFLIHEPLALDTFPTIITLVLSSSNMTRTDYVPDLMDPLYRITYSMRTYVWVRATGSEECTIMRDRLTTVVRSALLDHPCLRANDPQNFLEVILDEGTMREEFSDLTLLKGDRVLAGAFIAYDLTVNERITRKPVGVLNEFNVEGEMLDYNFQS